MECTSLCSSLLQVRCQFIWVLRPAHTMLQLLIGWQEAPGVNWPVTHPAESSTEVGC